MKTKISATVAFLSVLFFGFLIGSCRVADDKTKFGPDRYTSLVVFFRQDATREQIENFDEEVLSVSRPDVRGLDVPAGVALIYQIRNGEHEGVGITFSTEATLAEREKLKQAIKGSSIVFKIYENVVPEDIKDL